MPDQVRYMMYREIMPDWSSPDLGMCSWTLGRMEITLMATQMI